MAEPNSPKLSVVILTPDCYATIRRTMSLLRGQTIADDIEVIVVAPSRECLADDRGELAGFDHQVVEVGPFLSTTAARVAGIRRARSAVVALAEDHSFPAKNWAEQLVVSHHGPWAVVGPAMGNANPRHAASWANLAIEYGSWLNPAPSGPADHLPGHNSAYKRDILLAYGEDLEAMLEAETILHWDLGVKGYRLYLNGNAKTFHLNYTRFGPAVGLRFLGGRLFAAARARQWPIRKRIARGLSSPVIPFVRGRRILTDLRRVDRFWPFMPQIALLVALFLVADAIGEMFGYFFGSGQAVSRLTDLEFKRERFMKADEISQTGPQPENIPVADE
jgi:hypothetical protein